MFSFSLLAPLIVLMLYVIFSRRRAAGFLKAYLSGAEVPEALAKAFVDGWMLAGVLSVACITVPFSAQSILVRDRESGNMSDMLVSPIKRHIVGLSYLTSVFAVSLCICFAVLIVAFVYLALTGWYLSAKDVFRDCRAYGAVGAFLPHCCPLLFVRSSPRRGRTELLRA